MKYILTHPFYQVSEDSLREFVEENSLVEKPDGMHRTWVDTSGNTMARKLHGFFCSICEIRDMPNEETLKHFTNILNKTDEE